MRAFENARRHADAATRHRERQEYAAARAELEAALVIVDRGPPPWAGAMTRLKWAQASADLHAGLGEIGIMEGRPDRARQDLEQARHGYDALNHAESDDMSTVLNNLGVVYERLGEADAATACLRRSIAIKQRAGADSEAIAVTLNNIALARQAAGDPDGADQAINEALRLPGLNDTVTAQLRQERAYHLMNRGEYARALVVMSRHLEEIEQWEQAGVLPRNSLEAVLCRGNIGQAYAAMQRWEDAEHFQSAAVAGRRLRTPGSLALAIALSNLSETLSMRGDLAAAREVLQEAVGLAESNAPRSQPLAAMRGNLAGLLVEIGDPHGAIDLARHAVEDAPSGNRHLATAYFAAGSAYDVLNDVRTAEQMVEYGRRVCAAVSPMLPELRPLLTVLGEYARLRGDLDTAADRFDHAIAVAESQRVGASLEPGLERLFGTAKDAFHGRIAVAHERRAPEDAEAAFRAAESFRARTLAELLSRAGTPQMPPNPAGEALVAEDAEVHRRLAALYRAIDELELENDSATTERLQQNRRTLEQHAERLRLRLRSMAPELTDRTYPSACSVDELQACLDDTTLLALYEVTDDGTFLWAVSRERFSFVRLEPDTAALAAAVEEVLAACRDASDPAPDAALERLGAWLLRPLLDSGAEPRNLVICANDVLGYLPFEALTLDGTPVADRFVTRFVPSATTVVRFGGLPMRHLPVRDFAGFAMDETAGMGDLPGAPTEVREAAANFPGRAVCLVGADATVAAVRAHATGSRFVHFATHGVVNDRRPLYSGLPLAPGGDTSFLHAYEMFSLDLSADVVVCSACETAVGESRAGEGIVGLSYALFAAGAKAVLLSRWRPDRATADAGALPRARAQRPARGCAAHRPRPRPSASSRTRAPARVGGLPAARHQRARHESPRDGG